MKIYTRRGDQGSTGLFGGGRRSKDDARIAAYGDVDELNASLGQAITAVADEDTREHLTAIQRDLFSIGAHLATAPPEAGRPTPSLPDLPEERIAEMEGWIDAATSVTGELRNFVLPGGSPGAAQLHVSRTVCRRAERAVVALSHESPVDAGILTYMNRLSDYLFAASRLENHSAGSGDVEWQT